MSLNSLLDIFPASRVKPVDGMTVTAEIWQSAHEYHRQFQRFQTLLHRGWGVVTGLEVLASDPPDTSVYILPGVAVDATGQTIVLPQPVAYDIGTEREGLLYLLLSYEESQPSIDQLAGNEDQPRYVQAEFSLSAQTVLPNRPVVELARIQRQTRQDVFLDAANSMQPGPNEIDLRFRHQMGAPQTATMAVCYLGERADQKHGRGAHYLAHALGHIGHYRLLVDDDVPLGPGIEANTLIYLIGQGGFELSASQINGLSNYIRRGSGTLFIESNDSAAEETFTTFFQKIDLAPENIPPGHPLLITPHLFATPPPGFETAGASRVLVHEGVIFSTCNYGLLWGGEVWDGLPSREQIRSAVEWGGNIVAYAVNRRRRGGRSG